MDISQLLRIKVSAPSKLDEAAYEVIALELSSMEVKQGLWTKALSDAEWNEDKAKSLYVKMRHAQIVDEINNLLQAKVSHTTTANPEAEAREFGLTEEEIQYLGRPIKAIHYLKKYSKTQDQVLQAISKKKLTSVMKHDVLWVADKPL